MNIGLFLEFICGCLLTGLLSANFIKKKLGLLEFAVIALSGYFVVLCLISVILVLLDSFTPVLALSLSTGLPLLITIAPFRNKSITMLHNMTVNKDSLIIALFIIIMLPIVYDRYEYIEQNGDAGVYSVTAMHILKEGKLYLDHDVRPLLSNETKDVFDKDNWLPGTVFTPKTGQLNLQFYSGWPVMMALWGGMFGMENQHFVMVLLYIAIISLFYFIVMHFSPHPFLPIFITIVFGSSPLIVHFSKYPTTELFLLFLLLFCCYNLIQNTVYNAVLAGLGTLAYMLTHISYFMYLPLIFMILPFAYFDKNSNLMIYSSIAFVGFILSVPYGLHVSTYYFHDIYASSFGHFVRHRPVKYGMAFIVIASMVGFFIAFVQIMRFKKEGTHH